MSDIFTVTIENSFHIRPNIITLDGFAMGKIAIDSYMSSLPNKIIDTTINNDAIRICCCKDDEDDNEDCEQYYWVVDIDNNLSILRNNIEEQKKKNNDSDDDDDDVIIVEEEDEKKRKIRRREVLEVYNQNINEALNYIYLIVDGVIDNDDNHPMEIRFLFEKDPISAIVHYYAAADDDPLWYMTNNVLAMMHRQFYFNIEEIVTNLFFGGNTKDFLKWCYEYCYKKWNIFSSLQDFMAFFFKTTTNTSEVKMYYKSRRRSILPPPTIDEGPHDFIVMFGERTLPKLLFEDYLSSTDSSGNYLSRFKAILDHVDPDYSPPYFLPPDDELCWDECAQPMSFGDIPDHVYKKNLPFWYSIFKAK